MLRVAKPFRVISRSELSEYGEAVAQLAVTDADLRARGVPMAERDWEDGFGEFSASAVEVAKGERLVLGRFDHQPDALLVYAPVSGDPREPVSKLLTALDLPPECVTWAVPLDAWRDLRILVGRHARGEFKRRE
jgi:hypothetical protein